jgi:hypothetical protein
MNWLLGNWDGSCLGSEAFLFIYLGDGVFTVGFDHCYSLCGHHHMLGACFYENMFSLIN